MRIVRSRNILAYIAKDKISASKKFREELNKRLNELDIFLINIESRFILTMKKGYTIIYKIEKDKITILDIFKKEQYENL